MGILRKNIGPTLFLLYISDLPDGAICSFAIYADDTSAASRRFLGIPFSLR